MSASQTYDEKLLLLRIAEGDEASFTLLFNEYYRLLVSYVCRFTESVPVSEEIVQDVFLKLWMTRESLASVEKFRAYILAAARNQTINALKKIAREKAKVKALPVEQEAADESEDARYGLIDQAIDQLPPQRKKVYLMARHQRLSYDEIGVRLGLSAKTVKKHMQLAIASVTDFLKAGARLLLSAIIILKIFL